jgi:membrane protease YdiL (CAAX protease family)
VVIGNDDTFRRASGISVVSAASSLTASAPESNVPSHVPSDGNATVAPAVLGVLLAIAISTAMDAGGLFVFSTLPLLPLTLLFWRIQRLSRQRMGLVVGRWRHHGLAVMYPALVLGALTIVAVACGAVDVAHTDWRKAWLNCALVGVSTILMALLTEEGVFRGWLWASLQRAGCSDTAVLVWTSVAFALWHLSAVTLDTGFDLPAARVPLFLVNAAVMGAAWGLVRAVSGSVLASSVSHGIWNGLVYPFFGFGQRVGALGIRQTELYGPEVGILGLAANLLFVAVLWRSWRRRVTGGGGSRAADLRASQHRKPGCNSRG